MRETVINELSLAVRKWNSERTTDLLSGSISKIGPILIEWVSSEYLDMKEVHCRVSWNWSGGSSGPDEGVYSVWNNVWVPLHGSQNIHIRRQVIALQREGRRGTRSVLWHPRLTPCRRTAGAGLDGYMCPSEIVKSAWMGSGPPPVEWFMWSAASLAVKAVR